LRELLHFLTSNDLGPLRIIRRQMALVKFGTGLWTLCLPKW